jgi:hypothetical protein
MTQIVVILDENGVYQGTHSNCEVSLKVLRRGTHDKEIDETETDLEPIE